MKIKAVSGIMLTLLLISMLTLAFNIQPAKASGTIYIRADGSIEGTTHISSADNVTYTFTDNIYDEIVVERDNIVVDGNGYTLQGTASGSGFRLGYMNNVTIQNTNIKNFTYGIYLYSSSHNTISGNNITNNNYGIWLRYSSNNTLSDNVMNGNKYNLGVWGPKLGHFIHSIDVSNLVDGKPVYYLVNQKDLVINTTTYPQVGYLGFINSTNITVDGLTLTNNLQGLLLAYTNNSRITDNNIAANYWGILLDHSSNYNSISGNNITNNYYGISLIYSSNNTISGNNITSNRDGIWLRYSSNNSISGNTITNNTSFGVYLSQSSSNTVSGNTITKGGISLSGYSNYNSISGNTITKGGISLYYYSSNNSVSGNSITANNWDGIYLYYSSNNTVSGNNITANNWDGIFLSGSSNNSISGNNITNNWEGIFLSGSSNNSISGNNITGNNEYGVVLADASSTYNTIYRNNIIENGYGIWLYWRTSNNFVSRNDITANRHGIVLQSSSNNTICGNDITNNEIYGIVLSYSSNNIIYHNNFVDNTFQEYSFGSTNVWDDGYPSGGNYWSDHVTVDDCCGINQDEPGSDGIVDEPYIIDDYNRDNYPLVEPWSPVISATVDIDPDTLNLKSIGEWITCYIELPEGYNVSDIDIYSIRLNDTFPVSLLVVPPVLVPTEIGDYDNDTIPDLMVKFDRANVTKHITDVLKIEYGNVTLTVTGEVAGTPFEGADTIKVLLPGDVDDDGDVDHYDLGLLARAYGASAESPRYNWSADFNEDQNIDHYDFGILAGYYGKTAV